MILLDTHAFIWFVNGDEKLPSPLRQKLAGAKGDGLGLSAADRIILAAARILDLPIATIDRRIVDYPHARKV